MSLAFSTQGAHVFNWQPLSSTHPVLFCSEKAIFEKGKSIRGGIPVCWPWFGPKEGLMQHGFARTSEWSVLEDAEQNGIKKLSLNLKDSVSSLLIWKHKFSLTLNITVDDTKLDMELITKNTDNEPFEISQALHTYFYIDDIKAIYIDGLDDVSFIDKVDQQIVKTQNGMVTVTKETDRIYLSSSPVILNDEKLNRAIHMQGDGISSWVIWNPWEEKVKSINDMDNEEYKKFICIEAANADQTITIQPNDEYRLRMKIEVK